MTDQKKHLTISTNCFKNKKFKCLAYDSIKEVSLKAINAPAFGGPHPGSRLCTEHLRETVVMGLDTRGNQNSFCAFKDKSVIDNGTLAYYGRINDNKKK